MSNCPLPSAGFASTAEFPSSAIGPCEPDSSLRLTGLHPSSAFSQHGSLCRVLFVGLEPCAAVADQAFKMRE